MPQKEEADEEEDKPAYAPTKPFARARINQPTVNHQSYYPNAN